MGINCVVLVLLSPGSSVWLLFLLHARMLTSKLIGTGGDKQTISVAFDSPPHFVTVGLAFQKDLDENEMVIHCEWIPLILAYGPGRFFFVSRRCKMEEREPRTTMSRYNHQNPFPSSPFLISSYRHLPLDLIKYIYNSHSRFQATPNRTHPLFPCCTITRSFQRPYWVERLFESFQLSSPVSLSYFVHQSFGFRFPSSAPLPLPSLASLYHNCAHVMLGGN